MPFLPNIMQHVSAVMIGFGLGMAVLFTIQSNWETQKSANLTKIAFTRNTFLDLLGLALPMSAALLVGKVWGRVGQRLGVGIS